MHPERMEDSVSAPIPSRMRRTLAFMADFLCVAAAGGLGFKGSDARVSRKFLNTNFRFPCAAEGRGMDPGWGYRRRRCARVRVERPRRAAVAGAGTGWSPSSVTVMLLYWTAVDSDQPLPKVMFHWP